MLRLAVFFATRRSRLPEPSPAATHYLTLAYQLGAELGTVQREINVEVHTVESTLGGVHAFEVLLEVFAREVGSQGDYLLDACE